MWGLNDILTHSIAYAMGEEEERAKAEREKKASSNWHTGTPKEEGWYLCKTINSALPPFTTDYFSHEYGWHYHLVADYIKWQKIEEGEEVNG